MTSWDLASHQRSCRCNHQGWQLASLILALINARDHQGSLFSQWALDRDC